MCIGNDVCDGAGVCKLGDGVNCLVDGDCVSGFCIDSVCCENWCDGACLVCAESGLKGICFLFVFMMLDVCESNELCDGSGVCKFVQGEICLLGNECLSVFCADNVCCDLVCDGGCEGCKLGSCVLYEVGSDPDGDCLVVGEVCKVVDICVKVGGQVCNVGSECIVENCVDDVCCDIICEGECLVCDVGGSLGQCSEVLEG